MIITTASFKGGVAKTTTAIHLAAYLQLNGQTLLIDGDNNRSATRWAERGLDRGGLPFKVVGVNQSAKYSKNCEHFVIDTEASAEEDELREIVDGCDLLVLPTTPDTMSLDALIQTVELLRSLSVDKYRVLLTRVPSPPRKEGEEAREFLTEAGFPLFNGKIREAVAFQKAANEGVLVHQVSDRRARIGWNEYCAIGKEVFGE
ncbi:ParA family protein [Oculatella sp. LEGE 06141]|uniref:ParA family protein n=1 Tax=Oculatella sp. LEGE 06141 TaxID=1828648 RepID=UPI0018801943|nr:ParA family protein [Oculatella sp. LEGE 06141]MBE9180206.1 ParA family protein [Oculatella sp. LEGE 06141]